MMVEILEAVAAIRQKSTLKPEVGVILGSGLGAVAELVQEAVVLRYEEIPYFHSTTIPGHPGRLIIGRLHGVPAIVFQGRFHAYEGYTQKEVVLPTRVACAMGIHSLILTNAAGAINTRFRPGDVMLIEDHLNFTGSNPLCGPNLAELGPRFPDMTQAYNRNCIEVFEAAAAQADISVHKGVYCGLLGPSYETPAEIRMLRTFGADAVGMSTVAETIAANHAGVRVVGMSCITNMGAGLSHTTLTHQEVMEISAIGVDKIQRMLALGLPRLSRPDGRK